LSTFFATAVPCTFFKAFFANSSSPHNLLKQPFQLLAATRIPLAHVGNSTGQMAAKVAMLVSVLRGRAGASGLMQDGFELVVFGTRDVRPRVEHNTGGALLQALDGKKSCRSMRNTTV
jgi:hypothetical protein